MEKRTAEWIVNGYAIVGFLMVFFYLLLIVGRLIPFKGIHYAILFLSWPLFYLVLYVILTYIEGVGLLGLAVIMLFLIIVGIGLLKRKMWSQKVVLWVGVVNGIIGVGIILYVSFASGVLVGLFFCVGPLLNILTIYLFGFNKDIKALFTENTKKASSKA